jgi:hypothetical protein
MFAGDLKRNFMLDSHQHNMVVIDSEKIVATIVLLTERESHPQQPLLLEENDIQDVAPQLASTRRAGSCRTHPKAKIGKARSTEVVQPDGQKKPLEGALLSAKRYDQSRMLSLRDWVLKNDFANTFRGSF